MSESCFSIFFGFESWRNVSNSVPKFYFCPPYGAVFPTYCSTGTHARGATSPWRRTRDPYRIWLSEVILQQTRVAQGPTLLRTLHDAFSPTYSSLAAAPEDEVLKLWQELGYASGARNLLAAAREVMAAFRRRVPPLAGRCARCSGVGDYTAVAILLRGL